MPVGSDRGSHALVLVISNVGSNRGRSRIDSRGIERSFDCTAKYDPFGYKKVPVVK